MAKFLHILAITGGVVGGLIVATVVFAFVFLKAWKPGNNYTVIARKGGAII